MRRQARLAAAMLCLAAALCGTPCAGETMKERMAREVHPLKGSPAPPAASS
jgi:hypothetical protein